MSLKILILYYNMYFADELKGDNNDDIIWRQYDGNIRVNPLAAAKVIRDMRNADTSVDPLWSEPVVSVKYVDGAYKITPLVAGHYETETLHPILGNQKYIWDFV